MQTKEQTLDTATLRDSQDEIKWGISELSGVTVQRK